MSNQCPKCGNATVIGEPCNDCQVTQFTLLEQAAERIGGDRE